MIRYALKCDGDHQFESWFQSAEAFDTLKGGGHLACPVCGASEIHKAIMAPRVRTTKGAAIAPSSPEKPLSAPASPAETAIARIRAKIEAESDYVGLNFASEARAIYEGDAPERSIYGEAKAADAKSLIEDGVPVAPLPFIPNRKAN